MPTEHHVSVAANDADFNVVWALLEGNWPDLSMAALEPADAAASILARGKAKSEDIDTECLALLEKFRVEIFSRNAIEFDVHVLRLSKLLATVNRLTPRKTVADLHKRFMLWNGFFSNFVLDHSLDLRREYWRLLASTQHIAAEAGISPRRLMPMWLSICADSGFGGLFHESYLRVALMGLRRLPLGEEFSSNEDFALQGLARWAMKRKPPKPKFIQQWRVLEGDFPRSGEFWHSHVEAAVAAVEHELREVTENKGASFPAAQWWREDVDSGREISPCLKQLPQPVAKEIWEPVFNLLGGANSSFENRMHILIEKSKKHADSTGDTFYVVRTTCKFGKRLISSGQSVERFDRARLAIDLAKTAMNYEPGNEFAWSLYRDALVAAGQLLDAELIGWETIRRFPANVQWRTQLATVLAQDLAKPEEAAALLRETIVLFPSDAHARNQLAMVLADDIMDHAAAKQVLLDAQATGVADDATISLLKKLDKNRLLRGAPKSRKSHVASLPQTIELPGAVARRQLFLVENALATKTQALEELRMLARSDFVSFAIGMISDAPTVDTSFSIAFERAARAGSADALHALLSRATSGEKLLLNSAIELFEPANENEIKSVAAMDADVQVDNIVVLSKFIRRAHGLPLPMQHRHIKYAAGALLANEPMALAA